jgi:hypothetical protein
MDLAELSQLLTFGPGGEVVATLRTDRKTLGTYDLTRSDLWSCCGQSWVCSNLVNAYAAMLAQAAGPHVGVLSSFLLTRLWGCYEGCVAIRHTSFAHFCTPVTGRTCHVRSRGANDPRLRA